MKQEVLSLPISRESVKLLTDITYSQESFWFGQTYRPLKLNLLMPKYSRDHQPQPLLIWICGGGFVAVDKDVWMPEMVYYARRGFVVASIQYRTSNEAPFPAPIQDIKSAIRYLRAHAGKFCINPEKVAVMGESAGGHLAALAGVTGTTRKFDCGENLDMSSAVQAVVDIYGVSDISSMPPTEEPNYMTMLLNSPVNQALELAREASPLQWVDSETPPFFIMHGALDDMVPMEQSEKLADALEKNGVDYEFVVLKNAGHGADNFYQDVLKERVVRFLKQVLR